MPNVPTSVTTCPSCGGRMDVKESGDLSRVATCPYCDNVVELPKKKLSGLEMQNQVMRNVAKMQEDAMDSMNRIWGGSPNPPGARSPISGQPLTPPGIPDFSSSMGMFRSGMRWGGHSFLGIGILLLVTGLGMLASALLHLFGIQKGQAGGLIAAGITMAIVGGSFIPGSFLFYAFGKKTKK